MFKLIKTTRLNEMNERFNQLSKKYHETTVSIKEHEDTILRLVNDLRAAEKRTVIQQDEYESKIKELNATIEKLNNQVEAYKCFNIGLGEQINDEHKSNVQLEEQIKDLQELNRVLSCRIENLVADMEGQKTARIKAEEAYEKLQAEFSKYRKQNPRKLK